MQLGTLRRLPSLPFSRWCSNVPSCGSGRTAVRSRTSLALVGDPISSLLDNDE